MLQTGDTALHMAAMKGNQVAVEGLLRGGADPSALNQVGPLLHA